MGFDANILIKNLTKTVKDYSTLQAERTKIKGDLFINAIKAKQNFFFKQQEEAMKPAYQAQQALAERYKTQQPAQTTDSFGPAQSRVTASPSGFKEETPKLSKEYIYRRIQEKKSREMPLSEKEKAFESEYLGVEDYGEEYGEEYRKKPEKEPLIEPRAKGLGRIGRGAEYGEAVKTYGEEEADKIIGIIQDLQKEGKTFKEIRELMEEQNINAELFLKFYR